MYTDLGYPGSFHDVIILRHSQFYREWHTTFTHTDDYFAYCLGDLGYKGEDMFIMHRMDVHKVPPIVEDLAIKSYNNMHVGYRMQVGWGIP